MKLDRSPTTKAAINILAILGLVFSVGFGVHWTVNYAPSRSAAVSDGIEGALAGWEVRWTAQSKRWNNVSRVKIFATQQEAERFAASVRAAHSLIGHEFAFDVTVEQSN